MSNKVNIFWFRRDLRLEDNRGFYKALHGKHPVLPIFIFDSEILDELPKNDPRVSFISERLQKMQQSLKDHDSGIAVYQGTPEAVFKQITSEYTIANVITNHDYESYSLVRDSEVQTLLESKGIGFYTYKDQVIFEKDEVVKSDGTPYVVYTPYMKTWKSQFKTAVDLKNYDCKSHFDNLLKGTSLPFLTLEDIGFEKSDIRVPDFDISPATIKNYQATRNFPSVEGTSHLGPHLRFGTISIREAVRKAISEKNEIFWQELIWREFFMQILWHFPKTVNNAFRKKYDLIEWRNNEKEFEKWKSGKTGYPLVDAGMRELNKSGYMHNRVRMLVASFLCKHLLIDWRWGEAYFAEKLLDYEQASNVGNWQWAAGSGVDAAPYFRIFNPTTQIEKFDKDHIYIKKWIPEYGTDQYPEQLVDHKMARERCLKVYKEAVSQHIV
ncbi:cryptochrome/photolyase family protein [Ulvibacter antarcticus]|uniref:Deoxyribodipyrimidine photo-lyase n=1 Tax=Ulvibacter antarcticus TaxID=442714 RepID=A0A3L9Z2Q8_9FLAO|nr:deoxyribodipyrimidine photo-lyase [Ulvibacter antarcticus]RMA64585.1 deoxyribodipyrimidine photo-lyase [Ulvibacter antarcticus]